MDKGIGALWRKRGIMVNKQINVNLSSTVVRDRQFLTIEQTPYSVETVDAETAANFIDELYGTSICDDDFDIPDCGLSPKSSGVGEPPATEDINEAVEELEIPSCDYLDGYTTGIKIYLSDRTQSYKLILNDATKVGNTILVPEEKKLFIEINGETRAELKYPIIGKITAEWRGSVFTQKGVVPPPEIRVVDNDLAWDIAVTGMLQIAIETEYDLVKVFIDTPEDADSLQGAAALVFYLMTVDELDILPPDLDGNIPIDDLRSLCEEAIPTWPVEELGESTPTGQCYSLTIQQKKCDCSGNIVESNNIRTSATCPEDRSTGQVGPTRKVVTFVDCDESGRVNDPEYYEDVCCVSVSGGLPECRVKRSSYYGDGLSSEELRQILQLYGFDAHLIPVSPDEGLCGEKRVNQVVTQKDCCDDISDLLIDYEQTSPTIGLPGSANLVATGGIAPYDWKTSAGYIFANGTNEDITQIPINVIFTDSADITCGDAVTTLSDICSNVSFLTTQIADTIDPEFFGDMVMLADSESLISLKVATVGPYQWTAGGDLSWRHDETEGPSNVLISTPEFCGTEQISVNDGCGKSASAGIRSTTGKWELVPLGTYDPCNPPGAPFPPGPSLDVSGVSNGYKCTRLRQQTIFNTIDCIDKVVAPLCPAGTVIITDNWASDDCFLTDPSECGLNQYIDGCCRTSGSSNCESEFWIYSEYSARAQTLQKWVC